jgi:hypothetical protein
MNHIMGTLFVVAALALLGSMAFCMAFFPRVVPRLTNSYYSLIGMKTRVAEEDYLKLGTRFAGGAILAAEIVWLFLRLSRN